MALSEERKRQISATIVKYWEEVHAGIRPKPARPGPKFDKKKRKEYSIRAKAQWEALSPEQKKAQLERLRKAGACSWTDEQRKQYREKALKTRMEPAFRLKMSKKFKKVNKKRWEDPEMRKRIQESMRRWARSPEGIAYFKNFVKIGNEAKRVEREKKESEIRYAREAGVIDEANRQYREKQELYYNKAKNALKDTGIEPNKNQTIDYYKEIISYFEPDWVDWE